MRKITEIQCTPAPVYSCVPHPGDHRRARVKGRVVVGREVGRRRDESRARVAHATGGRSAHFSIPRYALKCQVTYRTRSGRRARSSYMSFSAESRLVNLRANRNGTFTNWCDAGRSELSYRRSSANGCCPALCPCHSHLINRNDVPIWSFLNGDRDSNVAKKCSGDDSM